MDRYDYYFLALIGVISCIPGIAMLGLVMKWWH